ncbi:hypothetical protein SAMN05216224_105299 [Thioclava dalianensis]|nr:hypothetical protein SAMN05216224_105299 [Thioclava dalianensis]
MNFSPEMVMSLANVGLLTGIFFRLGGMSRAQDDFSRRLNNLEGKANV